MRMIITLSCWLRNPWKSSCNCFYPVWLVAFTGTNKSLVTCIQNTIEGAVSIVALACCNDSLIQQLNEWDGVCRQILDLHIGALQETAHALGHYNGKKRTMIIRFLDLDTFQPHEKRSCWNNPPRNLYTPCLPIRPPKYRKVALSLAFKGLW